MTRTINGIEVARGVAALLVAVYHISRHFEQNFGFFPFGKMTEIGHSGVDFFFVLSGFIIFYIHEKDFNQPKKFTPYIFKRIVRVFPLYWIMLLAIFMLMPFVSSANYPSVSSFISQLFLLPIGMENLVLGVSWTLQFEMLFYVVFSFLLFHKTIGGLIAVGWGGAVIVHNFIHPIPLGIPVVLSPYILQFFMGCFAGYLLLNRELKFSKVIFALGFVYLFCTYAMELNGELDGYGKFARIHLGIAFTMIVIGIVGIEKNRTFAFPNILLLLGKSSYSIYLSHLFFSGIYYKIFEIVGLLDMLPIVISAFVITIVTVISSVLMSRWIEIPVTKLCRNFLFANQYAHGRAKKA